MTDQTTGITVVGRTFRPTASLLFPQYNWVVSAIRCVDRTNVKSMEDLMWRVNVSGRTEDILAGLLVEEGATWSPELAQEWKGVFASVSDPDECLILRMCLEVVVPRFFPGVVPSSESSEASSALSSTTPASTSEPPTNETRDETNSASLDLQPVE